MLSVKLMCKVNVLLRAGKVVKMQATVILNNRKQKGALTREDQLLWRNSTKTLKL